MRTLNLTSGTETKWRRLKAKASLAKIDLKAACYPTEAEDQVTGTLPRREAEIPSLSSISSLNLRLTIN